MSSFQESSLFPSVSLSLSTSSVECMYRFAGGGGGRGAIQVTSCLDRNKMNIPELPLSPAVARIICLHVGKNCIATIWVCPALLG